MLNSVNRLHFLKSYAAFFDDVKYGHRLFEVRRDDREFEVDDFVCLMKFSCYGERFLGEFVLYRIVSLYVLDAIGIPGFIAFTIEPVVNSILKEEPDNDE